MLPLKEERRCAGPPCPSPEHHTGNDESLDLELVKIIMNQTAARQERAAEQGNQMAQAMLTAMQKDHETQKLNFKEMFQFMSKQSSDFQKLHFEQQKEVLNTMKAIRENKQKSFGCVIQSIGKFGDVVSKIGNDVSKIIIAAHSKPAKRPAKKAPSKMPVKRPARKAAAKTPTKAAANARRSPVPKSAAKMSRPAAKSPVPKSVAKSVVKTVVKSVVKSVTKSVARPPRNPCAG